MACVAMQNQAASYRHDKFSESTISVVNVPGAALSVPSFRTAPSARSRASSTRYGADPESRTRPGARVWIPGSLAVARAPE
jgi:hypothetical protein